MNNPSSPWRQQPFLMANFKLKEARHQAALRRKRDNYREVVADPVYAEAMRERQKGYQAKRKAGV